MKSTELRQLIRESIHEYIKEIDEAGDIAAEEAKIAKYQEAIELREKKIQSAESLEEMKDMIDPAKVKALKNEIKDLQKSLKKTETKLEKLKNKGKKVEKTEEEKEVIDETPEMEVKMEEIEPMNESFLHMQKLAGVITEAQYNQKKSLIKEEENISPEQTAKEVSQHIDSLESDPNLKSIADKIANDPKATEELNKMLAKFDISLNEGNVDINPQDAYKMALVFAKKAETMNEGVGGAFWTGLLGGGLLAKYIASAGDVITPHMKLMGYEPSHMGAMAIGSIAGAALLVIAKMVYDKLKNK